MCIWDPLTEAEYWLVEQSKSFQGHPDKWLVCIQAENIIISGFVWCKLEKRDDNSSSVTWIYEWDKKCAGKWRRSTGGFFFSIKERKFVEDIFKNTKLMKSGERYVYIHLLCQTSTLHCAEGVVKNKQILKQGIHPCCVFAVLAHLSS